MKVSFYAHIRQLPEKKDVATMLKGFKRKKQGQTPARPEPESIPIDDTPYENVIEYVLNEAAKKAKVLKPRESFKVKLDPSRIPNGVHYMEIVGPVMMRSMDYGLVPGPCVDWTFEFEKM